MKIIWFLLVVLLIVGASGLWRLYLMSVLPEDEHDEHESLGI